MRNPRIAITLCDDDYQAIRRLARLTDQPMARLLSEMVELAMPSLKVLLDNLERLHSLKQSTKRELAQELDKAIKTNEEAIQMLYEVLNDREGFEPPSSNTGVTPL